MRFICLKSFNSTLVQLKVENLRWCTYDENSFNSTLVQLKAILYRSTNGYDNCFNSTLVQLKESSRCSVF